MRTIRLLCLGVFLVAAPAFAVAPPPRPLLGMEIEKLIHQMGDRNFALRDQAERRIRAEGVPALPYLRKAIGHKDPEIRRRALRMVPGLEHAALVAPKRITMSVRNQTIANVLAEVSKQSGYKVLSTDNNGFMPGMPVVQAKGVKEKGYSFTFVNVPFWDVIDKICRDSNMVVNSNWGDEAIRLQSSTGYSVHAGRDGAFRYSAMNLQLTRNIDLSTSNSALSAEGRSDNLTFGFQVFAEPRLPFLSMGEIRIDAAYDSEKNSMLVPVFDETNPNNNFNAVRFGRRYYGVGGNKQMSMQASVSLQRTSQKATTLKELRGVLPVSLLVEQKAMPIAEKILTAKGKKSMIGDLEFNIETVTKKPNSQFEIKFSIANKGTLNDFNWMNNIYQRLELLDAKGEKYQINGTNWHGSNGNSVTLTLTYSSGGGKMGDPDRFIFQHWVTRQHDINFVFREVPLP